MMRLSRKFPGAVLAKVHSHALQAESGLCPFGISPMLNVSFAIYLGLEGCSR